MRMTSEPSVTLRVNTVRQSSDAHAGTTPGRVRGRGSWAGLDSHGRDESPKVCETEAWAGCRLAPGRPQTTHAALPALQAMQAPLTHGGHRADGALDAHAAVEAGRHAACSEERLVGGLIRRLACTPPQLQS